MNPAITAFLWLLAILLIIIAIGLLALWIHRTILEPLPYSDPEAITATLGAMPPPRRRTPPKLTAHQRGYGWPWQQLRKRILQRDGYVCQYCGAPANSVDHVHPKADGGTDDPANLAACCVSCNSLRAVAAARARRRLRKAAGRWPNFLEVPSRPDCRSGKSGCNPPDPPRSRRITGALANGSTRLSR